MFVIIIGIYYNLHIFLDVTREYYKYILDTLSPNVGMNSTII